MSHRHNNRLRLLRAAPGFVTRPDFAWTFAVTRTGTLTPNQLTKPKLTQDALFLPVCPSPVLCCGLVVFPQVLKIVVVVDSSCLDLVTTTTVAMAPRLHRGNCCYPPLNALTPPHGRLVERGGGW